MAEPDYESICWELLALIDRIECDEDGEPITHLRFDIMKNHGIDVEFTGVPVSARQQ